MPTRKLVRDRKPALPWWQSTWKTRTVSDKEAKIYAAFKIDEETNELLDADKKGDKKAVLEELVDLYQIMSKLDTNRLDFCHHRPSVQDIIDKYWFTLEDVQDAAEQKAITHGRFDKNILLDLNTVA